MSICFYRDMNYFAIQQMNLVELVTLLGDDREGNDLALADRRIVRARYEALISVREEINRNEIEALAALRVAKGNR